MHDESDRILSAAVFLRSASGKHVRDLETDPSPLETDPSPEDLDGSREPRDAVDAVAETFARRGFDVIPDPTLGLVVIAGPAGIFASCFGVSETALQGDQVEPPVELRPPQDLIGFIEHITFGHCSELQAPAQDIFEKMPEGLQEVLPSSGQNLVGSVVGRFSITARLGAGGMGEVYRAIDTELKRTVAIKRLMPRPHDERFSSHDLLREAQRASALNHPCIASVYDVFT